MFHDNILLYFSIGRDGYYLPWDEFSAGLQRAFCRIFNAAAAGNLHTDDGQALNIVMGDDLRKFFSIIAFVQLWAANQRNVIADKVIVKISVSVSRTVGGNQQIGIVKVRCIDRNQLDLNRLLGKLTDRQALADYLRVERSAMSAEISKLRKDGVIECSRSAFQIL